MDTYSPLEAVVRVPADCDHEHCSRSCGRPTECAVHRRHHCDRNRGRLARGVGSGKATQRAADPHRTAGRTTNRIGAIIVDELVRRAVPTDGVQVEPACRRDRLRRLQRHRCVASEDSAVRARHRRRASPLVVAPARGTRRGRPSAIGPPCPVRPREGPTSQSPKKYLKR